MERRIASELRKASGSKLEGYAAVFNASSDDLGGFTEVIRPGAFRRTLLENKDILSLFDHDTRAVLGRTTAGTLRLNEDAKGLHFEIDMPATTLGRDLLVSVERGDIRGASFLFKAREDRWAQGNDGMMMRELLDVDLFEITVTAIPAYQDTEVARRTLARCPTMPWRADLCTRYIEYLGGAVMGLLDRLLGREGRSQSARTSDLYLAEFFGFKAGASVSPETVLSNSSVAVRCIALRSELLASIGLHVFRRSGDGGRERAKDLSLYSVLHDSANGMQSAFEFREFMIRCLDLYGNFYARIERNTKGQVTALYALLPRAVPV